MTFLSLKKVGMLDAMFASQVLSKTTAAILLHFLANGAFVLCVAYSNALFLVTYPVSWLPYWFMMQAIVDASVIFAMTPLLSRNIVSNGFYAYLSIAGVALLVLYLLNYHWFLVPFIFALLLTTAMQIIGAIAWNNASSAFDIIEFKKVSNWLIVSGTFGQIIFSILVVVLVKVFGIQVLIYILAVAMLLAAICLYPLQPLSIVVRKNKHGGEPLKYPLYQRLFVSIFLVLVAYTFVDYILKLKLSVTYDSQQIGVFIGVLMGAANVVTLLLSLFGVKFLISRFGITSLMAILPLYWVISGVAVIFFPSLWTIAILAGGRYIFYQSIFTMGRELVFNVLPRQVRFVGQFRLRSIAGPAAIGGSALLLFLFRNHINIPVIAFFVAALDLFLVIYIKRMDKSYVTTLKEEVHLKRFNMGIDLSEHNAEVVKEIVLGALTSSDIHLVRFGFSLLPSIKLVELPPEIITLLDAQDADIRIDAVKSIMEHGDVERVPKLLQRIYSERDAEVRWWLFDAVAALRPEQGLQAARHFVADQLPENRAGALRILFAVGNIDDELMAMKCLKEMIHHADSNMRKNAARVLGNLHLGSLQKELKVLIADPDDAVSMQAIDAAAQQMTLELASAIIARVSAGGVFHNAQKALRGLGAAVAPLIMQSIEENKYKKEINLDAWVRMLASITAPEVELCFVSLAQDRNPSVRNIAAKEMAYRSCHVEPSRDLKKQAKQFALNEAYLIALLRFLRGQYQEDFIIAELDSRRQLAEKRYLYWLAVIAKPKEVISLMPIILMGAKTEQAKAIELLNSLVNQRDLTELTLKIFLNKTIELLPAMLANKNDYLDDWLKEVMDFKSQRTGESVMQNMQKVFVLRSVELFKNLSSETLLVIAEEAEVLDMHEGQTIFAAGDPPTGLYIIVSGQVDIVKKGQVINELKENNFFGELALIDQAGRSASAIAKTEGVLLFLEKETFDRITDDLPDVLRAVVRVMLRYLRGYLAE